MNFYPRPPRGGRREKQKRAAQHGSDFYPRPPRGGRLLNQGGEVTIYTISIHALREEGDG